MDYQLLRSKGDAVNQVPIQAPIVLSVVLLFDSRLDEIHNPLKRGGLACLTLGMLE
jgi:hypothetical protein